MMFYLIPNRNKVGAEPQEDGSIHVSFVWKGKGRNRKDVRRKSTIYMTRSGEIISYVIIYKNNILEQEGPIPV